ncbi:Voltage-Dependent P/Q-Type Calcium Channel Subunit Alpha-1A [Manis pentadactyla]|nr:Voltage-Dependent P/Q-Type Calcium Channel Subunit Alpha-1A [Manis pentadactyla]
MHATVVHRLATGGANGRRLSLRSRRRGGGVGTAQTCGGEEAAARGGAILAGGGEGGSPRQRRGPDAERCLSPRLCGPAGLRWPVLGRRAVASHRSRGCDGDAHIEE